MLPPHLVGLLASGDIHSPPLLRERGNRRLSLFVAMLATTENTDSEAILRRLGVDCRFQGVAASVDFSDFISGHTLDCQHFNFPV